MKKMTVLILLSFLLVGCFDNRSQVQVTEVEDLKLYEEAEQFVTEYKEAMISSIEEKDFDILEPYLIPNNSFYHSLRRYFDDLIKGNASKELIHMEVNDVLVDAEENDNYFVNVNEEVLLLYLNGEQEQIERHIEYELIKSPELDFRIVTIREN
ncbi:hypothetical protein AZF04_02380 [Alkalihalobacillus trypoxylicola]|uniref:TcaA protein NTF2-like domain-containing protein n=2 Tax=Alkalihalobacillus trypoxylicola TaxID=519424 RepID=A0A161PLG2_9BACI|nr:hypothetical protein [Alkalihalobacillus trypoxylicola]KYG35206.1 hypothetical protein AZF04_02380 [Alkalihalobacillus trypoxylicola]